MKPYLRKTFHIAAAWLVNRLCRKKPKSSPELFREKEFSANTQKMGIRFTDKLRSIFRKKWIR
jgi:hypothetical protein